MIQKIKKQLLALCLAYKDPRTPWYAKAWAMLVVAYALSPIDLIPDFIPVIGYLDDIILVPIGIFIAIRLIPKQVLKECRERAGKEIDAGRWGGKKTNWIMACVIVVVWIAVLAVLVRIFYGPLKAWIATWH
jgi:uncharacterized membrane protein YkvA (DUF1232 family)